MLPVLMCKKVLKDFSKTQHKWILIAGWALLTITLLLNLFSHKKAIDNHSKSLSETNDFINNRSNVYDYEKIERRNKQIQRINTFTLYSLSFGLISLIVYTSINFYISD